MKKFISALLATLVCVSMCLFAACTPSNVEQAEDKMEEAGYFVIAYSNDDAKGLAGGLIATKITETITAAYFETSDDAKDFYETLKLKETSVVQDGKWVYWGSEGAVEDFTK